MNKETETIRAPDISRLIYSLRDRRVILDGDLSSLYGVETRALVQAVKRNADRFPEDFLFQLAPEEVAALRSQIVISKPAGRGGLRYRPYALAPRKKPCASAHRSAFRILHSRRRHDFPPVNNCGKVSI